MLLGVALGVLLASAVWREVLVRHTIRQVATRKEIVEQCNRDVTRVLSQVDDLREHNESRFAEIRQRLGLPPDSQDRS